MTDTVALNALRAVQAIYHAMHAHAEVGQLSDGTQLLELANGWLFRIFDDPSEDAPNGISWWLDSPHACGVESDGWENLTVPDPGITEIVKLAAYLDSVAQR